MLHLRLENSIERRKESERYVWIYNRLGLDTRMLEENFSYGIYEELRNKELEALERVEDELSIAVSFKSWTEDAFTHLF